MTCWEDLNSSRLWVAGDWHANATHAKDVIGLAADGGIDVILHVGDFAYDMHDRYDGSPNFLDRTQTALESAGVVLGWVDGNHDNHDKLSREIVEHGYTAIPIRPNIYYLPRGYRWTWNETTFLAMGGAHSVDRPWRRPHIEWWPGETITITDAIRACEGGKADVMVCHDAPDGIHIPCIEGNPHGFPDREIQRAQRNREALRRIVDVVQPRRLFAGHYHCRLTDTLHGQGYETIVDILDADFAPIRQNVTVLDLSDLAKLA